MLETNICHYLYLLLSLIVLTSEVHSFDSKYKYVLTGTSTFQSTLEMNEHPKNPKLFTLKGTLRPRNDATMEAFGREVKTIASTVSKEQQDIKVIANNVKWAARVNQGNVEGAKCSWLGPVNVDPVQTVMSLLTKKREETIPSHIKSLMLDIYERSALLRYDLVHHNPGDGKGFYFKNITREFN